MTSWTNCKIPIILCELSWLCKSILLDLLQRIACGDVETNANLNFVSLTRLLLGIIRILCNKHLLTKFCMKTLRDDYLWGTSRIIYFIWKLCDKERECRSKPHKTFCFHSTSNYKDNLYICSFSIKSII